MNYPVWDVAFGAGLLIAVVAILHVFVSHFAVGGGLFLVLTERKARRKNDAALLDWLKAHTKFFVLVTVVFGAISGVGIWFTIGLISPTATSNLIHIYVWGWAIEWVFFFIEITAALLYLYGWDKLDAAAAHVVRMDLFHRRIPEPGDHQRDHHLHADLRKLGEESRVLEGIFQSHLFPVAGLPHRDCVGAGGNLRADYRQRAKGRGAEGAHRALERAGGSCPRWPCCPLLGWWYIRRIPADVWASARGADAHGYAIRAARRGSAGGDVCAGAACAGPARGACTCAFSLLVALVALGAMGSFEFVRESVRKPYVISNYLYANSLYVDAMPGDGGFSVDEVSDAGVLHIGEMDRQPRADAGQPGCGGRARSSAWSAQSCHTANAYRGLKQYIALRQWDQNKIQAMLGGLDFMHNGVMPPFAGTDAERGALAAYLSSIEPISAQAATAATDGRTIFEQNCVDVPSGERPAILCSRTCRKIRTRPATR